MLGLLLLGMAAFWGLLWGVEILLQRADERAIWKALGESTQETTDRYLRLQEILDKYRKQKELAGKIFNKASDERFEALDAIAKLDKMLGSAEGEEYILLTQKKEGLEKFAKTLESGMEVLKEIFLCDEDTEEGRDKIDYILSTCGTTLEELAQSMGIDL
jgi:hypothetical protein